MAHDMRELEEWLTERGLPASEAVDFADVVERLVITAERGRSDAVRVRALLEAVVQGSAPTARPALPVAERAIWEAIGARFDDDAVDRVRVRRLAALAELVARSVPGVPAMAERLGVDRSRISQRLSERSLYAFALGSERWFPEWQLVGDRPLSGLKEVLVAVPAALHPLTVDHWFTRPSVDLEIGDEAVSPVDWLATGGDPAPVVALAADL